MLLDNPQIKKESKKKFRHYLEMKMIYKNFWDITKALLSDKYIEVNTYNSKK